MPVKTTYPNQFAGSGRALSDLGFTIETYQAYCQVPTVPAASIPLLDINTGLAFTMPASATNPRQIVNIRGVVLGNDLICSAVGGPKVGLVLSGDASIGAASSLAAFTRNALGAVVTGATIPRNTGIFSGGSATTGLGLSALTGGAVFSVFGANNETAAATAVNLSSAANRPCIIAVTFVTIIRRSNVQTLTDYPELPKALRELITSVIA